MKKTYTLHLGLSIIIIFAAMLAAAACTAAVPQVSTGISPEVATDNNDTVGVVNDESEQTEENQADTTSADAETSAPESIVLLPNGLTEVEFEGLVYMVEEEKLARDVYLTMYDIWQMNIFQNIASSEQTHIDSVVALLNQYDIENPNQDDVVGVFQNADLQALYDLLIAQGSKSLADALQVGAAIEEIDILDLAEYVAKTDHADIQLVYENLTRGSENHLRSFVSTLLKQNGIDYQPQYLSSDQFETIMNSSTGMGGSNGGGQGNGRP